MNPRRARLNYFNDATAAQRYAKGRPFFHPIAVDKICDVCCAGDAIDRALDVGCGTGQSTVALADIAEEIIGTDAAIAMLVQARPHPRVHYVAAPAEDLPFDAASFGLISVALAFHWFDRPRFMREAQRLLRPRGWLVIYNDSFVAEMVGNNAFDAWNCGHYARRYPAPPRYSEPLTDADARAHGFQRVTGERFLHHVTFTASELVGYLLTQTNVIAAVAAGKEDVQSIHHWLIQAVEPMFAGEARQFVFECQIDFLRRGSS